jgi:hypothetical protein
MTKTATAQELHAKAMNDLDTVGAYIFLTKLASLGFDAKDEAAATDLWNMGMSLFAKCPPGTPDYKTVKQASVDTFGNSSALPIGDKYSEEARATAEDIVTLPIFRDAITTINALDNA